MTGRRPEPRGRQRGRGRDLGPRDRARRHRPRLGAGRGRERRAPLDILVNNAGTDEFGFFTQTTPEQWEKVIGVNLGGVLNCTYAALPGMQEAGYGRIVSIASEAGRVGSKGSAVYSAAKGGVIAFTKVMARENARFGITANAIAPGPIETPLLMGAKEFGEIGEKIIETMKAGDPAEAARPARGGRRRGRLPRPPTTPPTSPARRSASPAAWGWWLMALETRGSSAATSSSSRAALVTDVGGTIGASVLSTPGMIGMMERTAAVLSFEHLPEGKATVGFEVCVKHVAAAAEGRLHGPREAARGRRRPQAALRRRGQRGRAHDRRRHPRAPRDRDRPVRRAELTPSSLG